MLEKKNQVVLYVGEELLDGSGRQRRPEKQNPEKTIVYNFVINFIPGHLRAAEVLS